MKSEWSYLERLWIITWTKVQVEWENYTVDKKRSFDIIWLVNDTKTYIINNVAKLLMLNPLFEDIDIKKQM